MGYDGIFSNIGEDAGILERIHTLRKYINDSTIISYGDAFGQIDFNDLVFNHKKSNAKLLLLLLALNILLVWLILIQIQKLFHLMKNQC